MSEIDNYEILEKCKDLKILKLTCDDSELQIDLEGGKVLKLRDEGQLCCEQRYLSTDDDLENYLRGGFLGAEIRESVASYVEPPSDKSYFDEVHDVEFLLVHTTKGTFTVQTHNEHNGYYGGFWVAATLYEAQTPEEDPPDAP